MPRLRECRGDKIKWPGTDGTGWGLRGRSLAISQEGKQHYSCYCLPKLYRHPPTYLLDLFIIVEKFDQGKGEFNGGTGPSACHKVSLNNNALG